MLTYQSNESRERSHFFITTKAESLHLLEFKKLEEEETSFGNEFLQDSVLEMKIVRLSDKREFFCKQLGDTIKRIFDYILFKYDDLVIYFSVPTDCWKRKLIDRYILDDNNDEFIVYNIAINGITIYFFFNQFKSNGITCLNSINEYFKVEYGVDLKILSE